MKGNNDLGREQTENLKVQKDWELLEQAQGISCRVNMIKKIVDELEDYIFTEPSEFLQLKAVVEHASSDSKSLLDAMGVAFAPIYDGFWTKRNQIEKKIQDGIKSEWEKLTEIADINKNVEMMIKADKKKLEECINGGQEENVSKQNSYSYKYKYITAYHDNYKYLVKSRENCENEFFKKFKNILKEACDRIDQIRDVFSEKSGWQMSRTGNKQVKSPVIIEHDTNYSICRQFDVGTKQEKLRTLDFQLSR